MGGFEPFAVSGKGLFFGRSVIPEHTGDEPHNRIDHDGGSEGSIGEDIVTDGDFFIDERFDDPVVDALVVAAKENEVVAAREFHGF